MDIEQPKTIFTKELEDLLNKEKDSRLSNDHNESIRLLPQIAKVAFDAKEYRQLNELLRILIKKRGQPKKAQIDMIQLCMKFVPQLPTKDQQIELVTAIKEVTEKKIFLEVEYARACLMLVKFNEDEGSLGEASRILQDVQVETYGSMDKREKLEFILYQMKMMIRLKDYVRLIIISRKINKKNIEDDGIEDLKILYYSYLIIYYTHENKFFDNATCYKAIYDTLKKKPHVREKLPQSIDFGFSLDMRNLLENYVLYLVIDSYGVEQVKHLLDLKEKYSDDLEANPHLKNIADNMLSTELISVNVSGYGLDKLELFTDKVENSKVHLQALQKQLIQHNVRIISSYYDRISTKRMANLVGVDLDTAETELCDMINHKLVTARINRPDGIVSFKQKKTENEHLNEWRFDIHKILDLVDNTTNLINREYDVEATA